MLKLKLKNCKPIIKTKTPLHIWSYWGISNKSTKFGHSTAAESQVLIYLTMG